MAKQTNNYGKRRYAAPIGGIFLALAVIGVITVIVSSIRLTSSFLDNDHEKQMFADIIRPVVMFNPAPFENPEDIEMLELLRYSMWGTLTGDNRSKYEFDDNVELTVPASDLDSAAGRLFGPDIKLVHQSFGDFEVKYSYDETDEVYNVPVAAQLLVYSPEVEEITKDGDYYNLLVAYYPPESAWTQRTGRVPDKRMIYVMEKNDDIYRIAKVQDVPVTTNEQSQSGGNTAA